MDVEDGLPCIAVAVPDKPITLLRVADLLRILRRRDDQVADSLRVCSGKIVQGIDVLDRNEEHVHRRFGANVLETDAVLIAVDDLSWHSTVANPAEDALAHRANTTERSRQPPQISRIERTALHRQADQSQVSFRCNDLSRRGVRAEGDHIVEPPGLARWPDVCVERHWPV